MFVALKISAWKEIIHCKPCMGHIMINKPKHCTMFRGNPWKLRAFELINFGLIPPSRWVALNDPVNPVLEKRKLWGRDFCSVNEPKTPQNRLDHFWGTKNTTRTYQLLAGFLTAKFHQGSPVSDPFKKGIWFLLGRGEYFPKKINKAFCSERVGPFWGAGQNALHLIGVINLFITRRGPPCSMTRFPTDQNKLRGIRNKK